jgi:hypothetical protein
MTIIETDSNGPRNTAQSTLDSDLSHPNQATIPHDGAFDLTSGSTCPLDLKDLMRLRLQRDLKRLPHVLQLLSVDFRYHMRRIRVQENPLLTLNIYMKREGKSSTYHIG